MASLIAWVCLRFIAFSHSNLNNVCINSNISNFAEKTELTIEDKYKKTMQEIGILKDELGNDVLFLSQVNQCHSIYPLPLPLASPWPKGRSLVISEWMCWSTSSDLASYCEVYSSKWSFVWKEEGIFFLRGSSLQHFSWLLDANKINNYCDWPLVAVGYLRPKHLRHFCLQQLMQESLTAAQLHRF